MKKVAIGLVIVGILILAGVMIFNRPAGPSQASSLAPADSVFFANIPDIPLTGFRWSRTALAQIAAEPDVRAFLEKPLARFNESPTNKETLDLLTKLKPGNIYLAATSASEQDFRGILGVQFWGKREDFLAAVAKVRAALPPATGEPSKEEYRGLEITATQHGDLLLHTAVAGRWGFFTNDASLIKEALDRATGNAQSPPLAANPRFLKIITELLSEPDLLVFLQPEKALDALLAVGRSMGAKAIPDHVDELKLTEAAGGAWKMDGEMIRDAFFLLREGSGDLPETISHESIALTTPETTLFGNFVLNFSSLPTWLDRLAESYPNATQGLAPLVQSVAEGYGPECALIGTMPSGDQNPALLVAMKVRNPNQNLLANATVIPGSQGGTVVHLIPHPLMPIAAAQNEKFLILGTDPKSVSEALEVDSKTLQDSPDFQNARSAYRNSNEAFCFLDTRVVFERSYGAILPIIKMSAALMPDMSQKWDVAKLPSPPTIGQHLPPIVFSQKRIPDGTRMESSGPVSMSQFLILAGSASAALNQTLFGP